jgi:hypothetical protein
MIQSPYDILARAKELIAADADFANFKLIEVSSGIETGAFPALSIYGDDEVTIVPSDFEDLDYCHWVITATIASRAPNARDLVPVMWEYGDRLRRFLIANRLLADENGEAMLEGSSVTTMFFDPSLALVDWWQAITLHWEVDFLLDQRRSSYESPTPVTHFRLEFDDLDTDKAPDEFLEWDVTP